MKRQKSDCRADSKQFPEEKINFHPTIDDRKDVEIEATALFNFGFASVRKAAFVPWKGITVASDADVKTGTISVGGKATLILRWRIFIQPCWVADSTGLNRFRSRHDLVYHPTMHIGQSEIASGIVVGEPLVIEPE